MMRTIATQGLVILVSCAFVPADATIVHKWVDADGVTHYSDEAPAAATTQVIEIDAPVSRTIKANVDSDYYSIANQWARLHKERIEQEKLRLERSRQEAARQPPTPQVVYIDEPNDKQYVTAYPVRYHYRHKRYRSYKKTRSNSGYARTRHYRGRPPPGLHAGRLKMGSYSNLQ